MHGGLQRTQEFVEGIVPPHVFTHQFNCALGIAPGGTMHAAGAAFQCLALTQCSQRSLQRRMLESNLIGHAHGCRYRLFQRLDPAQSTARAPGQVAPSFL